MQRNQVSDFSHPLYLIKSGTAIAKQQKEDQPVTKIGIKIPNILKLWQWYKEVKTDLAHSTNSGDHKRVNRYLSLLPNECLELDNVDKMVAYLRSKKCNKGKGYGDSIISKLFENLSPCVNLAKKIGKLPIQKFIS